MESLEGLEHSPGVSVLRGLSGGTTPPVPSLSLLTQHSQDTLQATDLNQPGEAAQGWLRYHGSIVDQAWGWWSQGDQQCLPTNLPTVHRRDSCSCRGQGQELPGEMDRHVIPAHSSQDPVRPIVECQA